MRSAVRLGTPTVLLGSALLGLTLAVSLVSCGEETAPSDSRDHPRILASWGEHVILPTYALFEQQTQALQAATEALCAAPDPTTTEAARAAWRTARHTWKQLEVFAFGPYSDFPARLGPNLDFWPARTEKIDEVLADDAELSVEGMPALGATVRGLPVMEYLLFAEADLPAAIAATPRRCELLPAVAGDVVHLATDLHTAWKADGGGFILALTLARGDLFMDQRAAISEVVNRMAFTLENIRRDKVGRPLGRETGGEPQPDKVESPFADGALDDIAANLEMIERLFEGQSHEIAPGLVHHEQMARRAAVIDAFRAELTASKAALAALTPPLEEAVFSQADDVQTLLDELADLQRIIQVEIVISLNLSVSFNDADGD